MKSMIKLLKRALFNAAHVNDYKEEMIERQSEILEKSQIFYTKKILYHQRRQMLLSHLLQCDECCVNKAPLFERELVVSLTTYGKRINTVWATIESIMCQTVKPNRITLWVSKDAFSDENIPIFLKKQQKRGLEIHYIEDVRSFTKLVPALQTYPDSYILTVDDDYLYPMDFIERFVKAHKDNPESICCLEARHMLRDENRAFKDFASFPRLFDMPVDSNDMNDVLPEGFAGVLYPPHSLHEDVCNVDKFLSLCPTNDDIWFRIMSLLKGTPVYIIQNYMDLFFYILSNLDVQDEALIHLNGNGAFDEQFKKVLDYYKIK